jgi:biotin carboxylase
LGKRRGALVAAARLDAEVLLLDDRPRPEGAAGAHAGARVDFRRLDGCVEAARRLVADRPVDAVVAVVERAVLPAAAIREALSIPGPTRAEAEPWRDKVAMKTRVAAAGLATAAFRPLTPGRDPDALAAALGLPLVLKPRDSSGSRGTAVVRDLGALPAALARVGPGWMAEAFVSGVEMSVESLVQGGEVRFENLTEYLVPRWANVVPAVLPAAVEAEVRRVNRAAIGALGVRDGLTHVEVFVRGGEVVFGELAARPPGGFIMDLMAQAYGFDPWRALLEIALGRAPEVPAAASASAGVWLLHPGEGRVAAVSGVEAARAVPGVRSVKVQARPGERVSRRAGVGEHKGRILACTPTRAETVAAMARARGLVRLSTRVAA